MVYLPAGSHHGTAFHPKSVTNYATPPTRHSDVIVRDQLNSRFHGRDIFREIDLLPCKTLISVKSMIFSAFSLIYDNSRVLSAAFVRMLLFTTCRTLALSSWHDCLES